MSKLFVAFVLVLNSSLPIGALAQVSRGEVISGNVAARYGLKRAWVGHVNLSRGFDHIIGVALDGDGLFVYTARGLLEMLDAETGTARWIVQFGKPEHPGTGPGISPNYVAITKGSDIYVVERSTGKVLFEKPLKHISDASPAIWKNHIYVPLFNGTISTYDLTHPRDAPWNFRGSGHLDVPPLVTPAMLAWATTTGSVYTSTPDHLGIRYQFKAGGEIRAPLAYQAPYLYAASRNGFVYAVNDQNGHMLWRFAAGEPVSQQPIVIGDNVYIVPETTGMYCLSAKTGLARWFAAGASQFVAASPVRHPAGQKEKKQGVQLARIYAADERGDLMILDAANGARIATMPTNGLPWRFTNAENDRMYLGTKAGLLQCLHEVGLEQPIRYSPSPVLQTPAKSRPAAAAETPGEEAATEGMEKPAEEEENPFNTGDEPK